MRFQGKTAFVNQFNYKIATAFFTNAFKRKAALNKWSLFSNFVLVGQGKGNGQRKRKLYNYKKSSKETKIRYFQCFKCIEKDQYSSECPHKRNMILKDKDIGSQDNSSSSPSQEEVVVSKEESL